MENSTTKTADVAPVKREDSLRYRIASLLASLLIIAIIPITFCTLSYTPIVPGRLAASLGFPLGVFSGNFIFDGWTNPPYFEAASAIVAISCLTYPGTQRFKVSIIFVLGTILCASLALLIGLIGSEVFAHYCAPSCTFSGMSTVAGSSVGVAFSLALGMLLVVMISYSGRVNFVQIANRRRLRTVVSVPIFLSALVLVYFFLLGGIVTAPDKPVLIAYSASILSGIFFGLASEILVLPNMTREAAQTPTKKSSFPNIAVGLGQKFWIWFPAAAALDFLLWGQVFHLLGLLNLQEAITLAFVEIPGSLLIAWVVAKTINEPSEMLAYRHGRYRTPRIDKTW